MCDRYIWRMIQHLKLLMGAKSIDVPASLDQLEYMLQQLQWNSTMQQIVL